MAGNFVVERATTIKTTPDKVFDHVVDLREWGDWSPWDKMDPNMTKTFSGEPATVGSGYHWTGNRKVGEGQMTVIDITDDERVVIDLEFVKPFKSKNVTEVLLTPESDGITRVTWRMTGPETLMTKLMGIFKSMDKMVGPDFEKGLASLKRISEG